MLKTIEKFSLQIHDCGLCEYQDALKLQQHLQNKRIEGKIPDTILLAEHPPTITLGMRENVNKLLANPEKLKQQKISVIKTNRGGGATAHNPGQIVIYPIINLHQLNLTVTEYIRKLEQTAIELLENFRLKTYRKNGFPGIWVENKKIASIGVRISNAVTYHGMAINIQNNLSIFDLIVPCGLEGIEMTSVLKETGEKISIKKIKQSLIPLLKKHFHEY